MRKEVIILKKRTDGANGRSQREGGREEANHVITLQSQEKKGKNFLKILL